MSNATLSVLVLLLYGLLLFGALVAIAWATSRPDAPSPMADPIDGPTPDQMSALDLDRACDRIRALEDRPPGIMPLEFAAYKAEVEAKLLALGSMVEAAKARVAELANTVTSLDSLEFATKDDITTLGTRVGAVSDMAADTRNQLALVGRMLSPPEDDPE